MCEIFPEFQSCCMCVSLRVGMMFISVFAIMTGVAGMSVVIQKSGSSYKTYENITLATHKKSEGDMLITILNLVNNAHYAIPGGTQVTCGLFIISGLILFIAVFTDSEGLVQVFVWLTFIALVVQALVVFLLCYHCIAWHNTCLLKLNWLISSIIVFSVLIYIGFWFYFISVSNSYVVLSYGV